MAFTELVDLAPNDVDAGEVSSPPLARNLAPSLSVATYPVWALNTFGEQIAPVLNGFGSGAALVSSIQTCGPGNDERTRFRLFPGALYLLWLEALGVDPTDEHVCIAAAVECLHNASLHHDDVLDQHDSRRGVPTLRTVSGASAALLAGDSLLGVAFSLVLSRPITNGGRVLPQLANAWLRMTLGQEMDEPAVWERVRPSDRAAHWDKVCRHKLALGNVAGSLAANSAGRVDYEQILASLHEQFSVVSQIMNDVGDLFGWAGFHVIAPCTRPRCAEARQKPTISTIWSSKDNPHAKHEEYEGIRQAATEIAHRTDAALKRLDTIAINPNMKPVLVDFFSRPQIEFTRVMERGPGHA